VIKRALLVAKIRARLEPVNLSPGCNIRPYYDAMNACAVKTLGAVDDDVHAESLMLLGIASMATKSVLQCSWGMLRAS